jgi:hypothetical protein
VRNTVLEDKADDIPALATDEDALRPPVIGAFHISDFVLCDFHLILSESPDGVESGRYILDSVQTDLAV